jgi:RNA polymerase sigma-70 factor, ECF subfamily
MTDVAAVPPSKMEPGRMRNSPGEQKTPNMIETYRDTINPLYAFVARRAGRSRQLAEDITQETYLRAVVQWRDGRRPDSPLAWLQTVARNLLFNHYRRRSPESLETTNLVGILETGPVEGPDAAALVYWGLARLGRRARRLLEEFYIEGKSTRMIATDLGVSERAIEGRLRRARQSLKGRLIPMMRKYGETP